MLWRSLAACAAVLIVAGAGQGEAQTYYHIDATFQTSVNQSDPYGNGGEGLETLTASYNFDSDPEDTFASGAFLDPVSGYFGLGPSAFQDQIEGASAGVQFDPSSLTAKDGKLKTLSSYFSFDCGDFCLSGRGMATSLTGYSTDMPLPIGGSISLSYSPVIEVLPALPEPATWTTMLLGFGMIGFGLRYRRRRTTVRFARAS